MKEKAVGKKEEQALRPKNEGPTIARNGDTRMFVREGDVWPNGNRGSVVIVGQTVGTYKELSIGDIEIELFAVPRDGKIVIRRLPT